MMTILYRLGACNDNRVFQADLAYWFLRTSSLNAHTLAMNQPKDCKQASRVRSHGSTGNCVNVYRISNRKIRH